MVLKSNLNSQSLSLPSRPEMVERVRRNCSAGPRGTSGEAWWDRRMARVSSSVGSSAWSFSMPSLLIRSSLMSRMMSLMEVTEGKLVIAMFI